MTESTTTSSRRSGGKRQGEQLSPSAAAELARLQQEARELFGELVPDVEPVDNPLAAYAQLAGRVLAWMELMDTLLGDLRSVGYQHERSGEQIRAEVVLYERAMDRANTVLGTFARLRIDERLAEITEKQKLTVIRAIEAAFDELEIDDPDKRQDVRRRVARHLRLLTAADGALPGDAGRSA